jgi:dTDP-3-amino-3,4,6-trideoxy-alpha-D-glucose transaminase
MIPMNDFRRQMSHLRRELDEAIARVIESGWYILGPEVEAFEREFAHFVGVPHAVGVGNGMEALELALAALGIGAGDEVITTPNSAFATALAIVRVGAKPVFVDIDDRTYALDPSRIAEAVTKKTRAVVPVHIYGQPAALDLIDQVCRDRKLFLVGDAAQAHGARFAGRDVATYGRATAYSFYPTKNLGALGDGGMVVTADADLAAHVRRGRNYGQDGRYHHVQLGMNSRLDEMQAAILRVKLRHLSAHNARRRAIAARYAEGLRGLPLVLPEERPSAESVFHLFVVRTPERDRLAKFLGDRGIETLVHYPTTIPSQPVLGEASQPVAEKCAREFLSLPIYPEMSDAQVDEVCAAARAFFA